MTGIEVLHEIRGLVQKIILVAEVSATKYHDDRNMQRLTLWVNELIQLLRELEGCEVCKNNPDNLDS